MGEYHYISPSYSYGDWDSSGSRSRRGDRYYDTTYNLNSPYEQMKRDRHKIAIAMPGVGRDSYGLFHEPPKVCRDDPHIPLRLMVDKNTGKDAWWCRECGAFWPLKEAADSDKDKEDKSTLPKESKSKIKQKDSSALKSFIIAQEEPQERWNSKFWKMQDLSEGLDDDEVAYISGLYGNVVSRNEYWRLGLAATWRDGKKNVVMMENFACMNDNWDKALDSLRKRGEGHPCRGAFRWAKLITSNVVTPNEWTRSFV